jgi:multiple sugar transport system permease protein
MHHQPGRFVPYLYVLPGLVLLAGIMWPFLQGVHWAFMDFTLTRPQDMMFNGGANILRVLRPGTAEFRALLVTLRYAASAVVIETALGFTVALLLTWPARWTRIFRTMVILPMLVPPIAATLLWKVMLVDQGVVNYLLSTIGISAVNWLGSPGVAIWTVLLIDAWIFTPFAILILLAGLQSIPVEIIEAATIDGTGIIGRIRYIYLPMCRPFLLLVVLFRGIDSLKMFDIIWAATKGGPVHATMTLHILGYLNGVDYMNYGRSMAVLFVLWILCYGLSMALLKVRRQEVLA